MLTTHKHHDHAGGNLKLQKLCGNIKLRVYGHVKDRIPGVTTRVKPGDVVKIGETNVGVVHVPVPHRRARRVLRDGGRG